MDPTLHAHKQGGVHLSVSNVRWQDGSHLWGDCGKTGERPSPQVGTISASLVPLSYTDIFYLILSIQLNSTKMDPTLPARR